VALQVEAAVAPVAKHERAVRRPLIRRAPDAHSVVVVGLKIPRGVCGVRIPEGGWGAVAPVAKHERAVRRPLVRRAPDAYSVVVVGLKIPRGVCGVRIPEGGWG